MRITNKSNASWLYEKAYFKGLNWEAGDTDDGNKQKLEEKNQKLYQLRFSPPPRLGNLQIDLTTTNPGLLMGSGYPHEIGFKGELKLGFSFDYTLGLPVIPGSSIKGVLRSIFKHPQGATYLTSVLESMFGELSPPPYPESEFSLIQQLEKEIFEGSKLVRKTVQGKDRITFEPIRMNQRDVFYDAFPTRSTHKSSNRVLNQGFLAPDFITPHINRENASLSPFTEPTPLAFLKVLPGVVFRFDFKLQQSQVIEALTAERKRDLFSRIICDFGLGAKTAVGYGQFVGENHPKTQVDPIQGGANEGSSKTGTEPEKGTGENGGKSKSPPPPPKPDMVLILLERATRGREIQATVIGHEGRKIVFQLGIEGYDKPVQVNGAAKLFPAGTICKVIINDARGRGEKLEIQIKTPSPKNIIWRPDNA